MVPVAAKDLAPRVTPTELLLYDTGQPAPARQAHNSPEETAGEPRPVPAAVPLLKLGTQETS
jgi:hypothetical protein